VVLDVAKLTPGREDYYLQRLADNREEYLSGHGESPGRWCGRGAASKSRRDAKRCLRRVIARQRFRLLERYGQPGVEVLRAA
jgi:hypothetical protein